VLPNFFVIGANKAGTSSLSAYLDAHPAVYMSPIKEPGFYALNGEIPSGHRINGARVRHRADYEALFDCVTDESAVGEASTAYLPSKRAPALLHADVPDAKLVAVLRDPSARTYSAHSMYVSYGLEQTTDFEAAVDAELAGQTDTYYVARSLYASALERWFNVFPRDQFKIFLYEDLDERPADVVREIFTFLDVDPDFEPRVSERVHVTTIPKSRSLRRFTKSGSKTKTALKQVLPSSVRAGLKRRAVAWNEVRPDGITPAARRRLVDYFADDIDRTEALIGRDLSAWRAVDAEV
jgi:hypothetical protein